MHVHCTHTAMHVYTLHTRHTSGVMHRQYNCMKKHVQNNLLLQLLAFKKAIVVRQQAAIKYSSFVQEGGTPD